MGPEPDASRGYTQNVGPVQPPGGRRRSPEVVMLLAALVTVWLAIRLGMPQPAPEASASPLAPGATGTPTPAITAPSSIDPDGSPGPMPTPLMPGTWQSTAAAPIDGRMGHVMVWTGTEALIWGGAASNPDGWWIPRDGAAYNPAVDSWRIIPPAPIEGREHPLAAWSGSELLVWGGFTDRLDAVAPPRNDGAAYDPATDRWRRLPPAPLELSDAVGGWLDGALYVVTSDGAARYRPREDTWTSLDTAPLQSGGRVGVIAGEQVVVIAFGDGSERVVTGAILHPATGAWTNLQTPFVSTNVGLAFIGAGDRVVIPEPRFPSRIRFLRGGLVMEQESWRSVEPCPGAARGAAWTGRYVIGVEAAYDMVADQCLELPPAPPRAAPFDRTNARAETAGIWTGTAYVIWSGPTTVEGGWVPNDGAVFHPAR